MSRLLDLALDQKDCDLNSDKPCDKRIKCLPFNRDGKVVEYAHLKDGIKRYCEKRMMEEAIAASPENDKASLVGKYRFLGAYRRGFFAPFHCDDLFKPEQQEVKLSFTLLVCTSALELISDQCPSSGGTMDHECDTFSLHACPPRQECQHIT